MKIALITDDGQTVSQHFGRAVYYAVLTLENGKIVGRELRQKANHNHFTEAGGGHSHEPVGRHGFDPASRARHEQMAEAILDCEAVLCRGMGSGAYAGMKERGLRPVLTDIAAIDEAALAYADGSIVDHVEKLH